MRTLSVPSRVWWSCALLSATLSWAGVATADEPGALVLYASDRSKAGDSSPVDQELENLCSALASSGWVPPTFVILSDDTTRLLKLLGRLERESQLPLHSRRSRESEVEQRFVEEVLKLSTSPNQASSALRQCSVDAAKKFDRAVGLQKVDGDQKLLHLSARRFHVDAAVPEKDRVRSANVSYDARDASVLANELARHLGLGGTLEVSLEQAGDVTLQPAAPTGTAAALTGSPQPCSGQPNPPGSSATEARYFCSVPPGHYVLTGRIPGCAEVQKSVSVVRHSQNERIDCEPLPAAQRFPDMPEETGKVPGTVSENVAPAEPVSPLPQPPPAVPPLATAPTSLQHPETAAEPARGSSPFPLWPSVALAGTTVGGIVGVVVTSLVVKQKKEEFFERCPGGIRCLEPAREYHDDTNAWVDANRVFWVGTAISAAGAGVTAWLWYRQRPPQPALQNELSWGWGCFTGCCSVLARGEF